MSGTSMKDAATEGRILCANRNNGDPFFSSGVESNSFTTVIDQRCLAMIDMTCITNDKISITHDVVSLRNAAQDYFWHENTL